MKRRNEKKKPTENDRSIPVGFVEVALSGMPGPELIAPRELREIAAGYIQLSACTFPGLPDYRQEADDEEKQ